MYELCPEVIRRKIERIRLDFILSVCKFLIDVALNGVEPIPVVPHMKIFLILHMKHLDQLFLCLDDRRIDLEERFDQPLTIAPNCIRFRIGLNELGCKLYLASKQLTDLFRGFVFLCLDD